MLDLLISSDPGGKRSRGIPGTLMSTIVHAAFIWGAITVTSKSKTVEAITDVDTTIVVFPREQLQAKPKLEPDHPTVSVEPFEKGFKVVPPVIDVPTEIPPVTAGKPFDPRDYLGEGVEGGAFDGVVDRTLPVDPTQTMSVSSVDEPPERLSGPDPRYPNLLREAGIEGTVVLRFVIDTTGIVEPSTLVVISTTHRAFEGPAREAALRSRYRPARVRGVRVRVLVQQAISFTIR